MLDLRLPTGAVRIAAPAACANAPRSVAVIDLCIAVTDTGLDTVRVVLDKVVDIIVEIRVGLPVVTPVAVLLIQVLVCRDAMSSLSTRIVCRVVDGLALVRHGETMRRGVRPLLGTLRYKPGAARLARLLLALRGI